MYANKRNSPADQKGFTLIELMVSMVIGLLVVLAGLSMAQFFVASQRQSAGVGTAQANGLSALDAIKYEAAQAGLGLSIGGMMPCTSLNLSLDSDVLSDGAPFVPLSFAANGVKGKLTLSYGTALEGATPGFTRSDQSSLDTSMELVSYLPASAGQAVMIAPPLGVSAPCTIRTITEVSAPSGAFGYVLKFGNSGLHNKASFSAVTDYADSSQLFLLGQLRQTVFSLNNNEELVMSRPLESGSPSVVLARGVVGFTAQFGVTDGVTQTLQSWEPATGAWATPSEQQISRIHALRIGVTVRSEQKQKSNSAGICDATTEQPVLFEDGLESTTSNRVTMALTGDWKCYKYRSLSAVVPLRNMVLGSAV